MNHAEHYEQCLFVQWFRSIRKYDHMQLYAIPNQLKGNARLGSWLKAEGKTAGIPDTCLAYPNKLYHGLYIEFKSKEGRLSDDQLAVAGRLMDSGYSVKVARSCEEAIKITTEYLK